MAATATTTAKYYTMKASKKTTTLLVGVDYSEHSYHALEEATRFVAARFPPGAAEVIAVHARRPLASAFVPIGAMAPVMSMEEAEQRAPALGPVRVCVHPWVVLQVEVKLEVKDGEARRVLCDAAGEHGAGVLVVGSHGYGPILRALLGSVSDYCCRRASCPVMVVNIPQARLHARP